MTNQEKMNAIALTFGAKTGEKFSRHYIFNGVGFSTASPLYKPKKELVFNKMLFSEVA
jgi:hypothetical protein